MSWIKTIPFDDAEQKFKQIYNRVAGHNNNIDNVLMIHSLRPHTLVGHMTLYKSVLHNSNNTLEKWYLESLGVYVSFLNNCSYCVDHHLEGLKRLLGNDEKGAKFYTAVQKNETINYFGNKLDHGMEYARMLTQEHHNITKNHIDQLRIAGFEDGEILEINQVSSYFNYVNRMVVGLGVDTKGDIIGLSPGISSDPKNWEHQ